MSASNNLTKEEPFFFLSENKRIFSVLHYPDRGVYQHNTALILCAPFAEEKLWSQRVFVSFAREMAKKGFTILRFDYMGHGDSEGDFEDSDVYTRLSDIKNAIITLQNKTKVGKIGLLGLRFGATMAAIAAQLNTNVDFLILWEPILKGKDYLQRCLRSNLATQMAIYKKIIFDRKTLTEQLLKGKNVNIDGYMMSGNLYMQSAQINFEQTGINYRNPIQLVHITKMQNSTIKKDILSFYQQHIKDMNQGNMLTSVCEDNFWREINTYYQNASALFDCSLKWIINTIKA